MKKQAFKNGSIKVDNSIKIEPKKSPNERFVEKLERTNSVLDFYKHKPKILELLRETRK